MAQWLISLPLLLATACSLQPTTYNVVVPVFHDTFRDGSQGPSLALIPAGNFVMGDGQGGGDFDETPVHKVTVGAAFALGVYEVTVREFARFIEATGYITEAEHMGGCMVMGGKSWREPKIKQAPDHPVTCVTWADANAYTAWLSAQTGRRYGLPTEAQWEYAARAGVATRFSWGDAEVLDRANCFKCLSQQDLLTTTPVGSYAPNGFGLYDMEGNVWEWTASEWVQAYDGRESLSAPDDNVLRQLAIRSGSFLTGFRDARLANRGNINANWRYNNLGFRVARDP